MWEEVFVPQRFATWFQNNRTWPVQIQVTETAAAVKGGPIYRLHAVNEETIRVIRPLNEQEIIEVGAILRAGVFKPVSEAAKHDLSVIRSKIHQVSYPSPLAYVMGNGDHVHPGPCFEKHRASTISRTLYSVRKDDLFCVICQEAFE